MRWPFAPACRGKGDHGNMACACDSLSHLPVEETAIMGTRRALANPFSPCLSRERQSWGACDSFFSLPVEEKDSRGTPQISVAGVHMGLRSALKGSVGLRRALWLGIAFPVTGRGKRPSQARLFGVLSKVAFSPTGRGKMFGDSQNNNSPPWRWGFEHFEASGGAFSSTGRGKTAFAARIGR